MFKKQAYGNKQHAKTYHRSRKTPSLFFGWIPVFGWVIWILSLVFSFIAVFKRPRGLAIAGLILSIVGLIFIVFLYALIAALAADEL